MKHLVKRTNFLTNFNKKKKTICDWKLSNTNQIFVYGSSIYVIWHRVANTEREGYKGSSNLGS